MRVAVTGANGYIGQGVVKALLNLGVEVVATDLSIQYIDKRAKTVLGNIFEMENPYEELGEPDVLLHLAWRDGFVHYSDAHIEDIPLHFEFIKKMSEASINKICIMGSMHEIGFYEGSIDENTPTNPESYYGVGKNALRELSQILVKKNGNKFQWLRGFYIVGNTTMGCSIFSKITQAENEGKEYFPFTMGENQFDFIEYDDFCVQIAKTVIQDKILGIINCCSGKPMKLSERVEQFIKDNKYHIKLEYGAFPDRPYDSKAVWGNDTKIRQIMDMK